MNKVKDIVHVTTLSGAIYVRTSRLARTRPVKALMKDHALSADSWPIYLLPKCIKFKVEEVRLYLEHILSLYIYQNVNWWPVDSTPLSGVKRKDLRSDMNLEIYV
jgi:hypothetical protein